jgi:hypothetical protein
MSSSGPANVPPPAGTTPVQDPTKATADAKAAADAAAAKAAAAPTPAPNPTPGNVGVLEPFLKAWTNMGNVWQIIVFILFTLLPYIIVAYGAAKISWSVNQSPFWAVVDFLFAGFYYPYYAYFQLPQPGVLGALGAARRRR